MKEEYKNDRYSTEILMLLNLFLENDWIDTVLCT